jgi:hypothetical protein
MKTLKINGIWRIETDNDSSTLISAEKKIRKDGKNKGEEYLAEHPYYYNNIESCLQAYFLKTLDDSKDLKDVLRVIAETKKEIKNAIQNSKTM